MARAIPTYQRQNLAGGVQSAPNASSNVSASDPVASALGNLGQAVGNVGNMMAEQEIRAAGEQKKKLEGDAAVNTTNVLAQGDVFWQENAANRMKAWKPGDPDMREGIGSEFDKWQSDTEQKLTTDASKNYFRQHAATMKARLQTNAFSFQEKSSKDALNAQTDIADEADKVTVSNDPTRLKDVYQRKVAALAARPDLSAAEKIKQEDTYKRGLYLAVEMRKLRDDPSGYYRERFGSLRADGTVAAAAAVAGGASRTPVASPGDPSLPAGMRNNNPGNIKFIGQKDSVGPSKNTDQGDPQAVYASPEDGMAAMYRLALRKYDGGKVSANSLIAGQGGWTPGNTAAAANVAKNMGIAPDDNLNLRDPAQLKKFARALMLQEHGQASKKYGDDMVGRVADDVLAGRSVQAVAGGAPAAAGAPGAAPAARAEVVPPSTFSGLNLEQQQALQSLAETRVKQDMAVFKAQVDSTLRDAVAMHKDGIQDPQNIPVETFDRAYGAEAPRMYAEYQKSRLMGADIGAFKTQSEPEIMAALERTQPVAGPNYAAEDQRQSIRVQAAQAVLKQRKDDPVGYATKNSDTLKGQQAALAAPSLSPEERTRLTQDFVRNNLAEQQRLGIASPQVLTPGQSDAIAMRAMKATRPEDSANLIAGLEAEYGEFFPRVFDQLVKDGKIAGELLIIPNLPSQTAREAVSRLARVKETDLVQGIDASDQKAVKEAVVDTLSAFSKTIPLMTQQAAGTVNAYETTLRKLTYQFMQGGTKASDAAEQARTMLLGQYSFEGTTRIPKSVNASQAMTGAARMLEKDLDNIDLPRDLIGTRTGPELQAEWLSTVRSRPQWFAKQDDGGVELWAMGNNGSRYRVTRGGQAVSYTWEQLMASNVAAQNAAASEGGGARARQRANKEASRLRIEETRRQVEAEDGAK